MNRMPAPSPSPTIGPGMLDLPLTVKEVAGVGSDGFPVSVVVPMPFGRLMDADKLRVVDSGGAEVPSQIGVLERHWAKDGSIRHLMIHLQPTVPAFSGAGSGTAVLHLRDDTPRAIPSTVVAVNEGAGTIELDAGPAKLKITKSPLAIEGPTGPIQAIFTDADGQEQRSFDRSDLSFEIEERGPLVAIVRISAPTIAAGPATRHGWALRLYAYAGKPYFKLDLQLQNSAKDVVYPPPLFFHGYRLELPATAPAQAASLRAQVVSVDPKSLPLGALDGGSAQAFIRHFQVMWPNGLSLDSSGKLSVELWPSWSAQDDMDQISPTGLYWLNDMQAVVKEVLLRYGTTSPAELSALSKTLETHPVITLPTSWWADTAVSLDLGGLFPVHERLTHGDDRLPPYSRYSMGDQMAVSFRSKMGWNAFGADLTRRNQPNTTGGWPPSVSRFLVTEDPADYWYAEDFAMAELNVMPEWVAGYTYADDFAKLQLTENPYGSYSWRKFDGTYGYNQVPGYSAVAGSRQIAKPRDDQHSWFYHVGEAYVLTGNPWIRDWYRFIAQYRRTRLHQKDPFPDMSGRATGHALSQAIWAYRVLGDKEILDLFKTYVVERIKPDVDPMLGGRRSHLEGGTVSDNEATFQLGYLARSLINYLEELPAEDAEAKAIVGGFVHWNVSHGNFGYYQKINDVTAASDGSGLIFCDPQAWWVLKSGERAPYDHLKTYMEHGIGTGMKPYGDPAHWSGDFNGRAVMTMLNKGAP